MSKGIPFSKLALKEMKWRGKSYIVVNETNIAFPRVFY